MKKPNPAIRRIKNGSQKTGGQVSIRDTWKGLCFLNGQPKEKSPGSLWNGEKINEDKGRNSKNCTIL